MTREKSKLPEQPTHPVADVLLKPKGTPPRKKAGKPRASAPGKQDQRKTRSRVNILQAASKVFGRHGYANTRVEDILEAASISRPTFYRFFRSKEDVFETIDEVGSLSLLQMVSSAVTNAESPFEKIEQGVDAYLRWLVSAGTMAAVVRQESMRPDSRLATRREATVQMLSSLFEGEFERLRGYSCDPWLFSVLIAGVEHAGELLTAGKRPAEADIQRAKSVVLRVFMASLTSEESFLPPVPKAPR